MQQHPATATNTPQHKNNNEETTAIKQTAIKTQTQRLQTNNQSIALNC
jgi:hypothetical protein